MRLIRPTQWFLFPLTSSQSQIRKQPGTFCRAPAFPFLPCLAPVSTSFLPATVAARRDGSMAGKSMVDPRCTNGQAGTGHHLAAAVARVSEPAHVQRRGGFPIPLSLSRTERKDLSAPSSPRRGLATKAECSLPAPQAQARHSNPLSNLLCSPLTSRPLQSPSILPASGSLPQAAFDSEADLRGQEMSARALGGATIRSQLWEDLSAAAEMGGSQRQDKPGITGVGKDCPEGTGESAGEEGKDEGMDRSPSSLSGKKRKDTGRSEPALEAAAGDSCHQSVPSRDSVAGMATAGRANVFVEGSLVAGVPAAVGRVPREETALPVGPRQSGDAVLLSDSMPRVSTAQPGGEVQPSADEGVASAALTTDRACQGDTQGQSSLGEGRPESGEAQHGPEGEVSGREVTEPEEGNECGTSGAQPSGGGVVGRKEEERSEEGRVGMLFETTFQLAPCLGSAGREQYKARADLSLVVLNFDLPPFTHILWEQAGALRVCADGGANRLYDGVPLAFPGEEPGVVRNRFIPDVIKGDLDSIRPEVLAFYESKGTRIFNLSEDQDTTDLHKCIQHVLDHHGLLASAGGVGGEARTCLDRDGRRASPSQMEILVVGGLGGRVDHEFGNINVLHRFKDLRIVLLSSYCLLTLLPAQQRHVIRPNLLFEGPHCGLIPVYQASAGTTTTGLRWNLRNLAMSFGGLVSTSNQLAGDEVTVESDVPLLWTTELRLP